MFHKIDEKLIKFGEAVVYMALLAITLVAGFSVIFAIPIVFVADIFRGDIVGFLEGIGLEIATIYLIRGTMNIINQIHL